LDRDRWIVNRKLHQPVKDFTKTFHLLFLEIVRLATFEKKHSKTLQC